MSAAKHVSTLNHGVKRARGGKRAGAGRKPDAAKAARDKFMAAQGKSAEAAFRLVVRMMKNQHEDSKVRLACAELVMERVWGKAAQPLDGQLTGEVVVRFGRRSDA